MAACTARDEARIASAVQKQYNLFLFFSSRFSISSRSFPDRIERFPICNSSRISAIHTDGSAAFPYRASIRNSAYAPRLAGVRSIHRRRCRTHHHMGMLQPGAHGGLPCMVARRHFTFYRRFHAPHRLRSVPVPETVQRVRNADRS